jgi:hypothetical protein
MKHRIKIFGLVGLIGLLTFTKCSDDDDPEALKIVSVTSTGTDLTTGNSTTVDLNGATTATNVPPDGVITITFSKALDAATVTSANVTLSDGTDAAATTVAANGNAVTITPTELLTQGTTYTISVSGAVKASDGVTFSADTRTFTTAGTAPPVVPQVDKLVVYLPFNGVVQDELDHTILNDNVTFATDRFGNFESSADFNGTTNYVGIEYGTDMSNASTTVSYWIKLPASEDYADHIGTTGEGNVKQYVTFSIGGNNGTYHEWNRFTCCDLGYDIDVLKYFTNHLNSGTASELAGSHIEMKNEGNPGGDKKVEVNNPNWTEDITGEWAHIVTSWNATARRKSFYINGVPSTVYELTPSAEYALDDAVIDVAGIDVDASNSKNLYLGSGVPYWATKTATGITPFRSDIPFAFKGQMDDFRMFSVALTDAEVLALYNAEKP